MELHAVVIRGGPAEYDRMRSLQSGYGGRMCPSEDGKTNFLIVLGYERVLRYMVQDASGLSVWGPFAPFSGTFCFHCGVVGAQYGHWFCLCELDYDVLGEAIDWGPG